VLTSDGVATEESVFLSTDDGVATDASVSTDEGVFLSTDEGVATDDGMATEEGVFLSTDEGVVKPRVVASVDDDRKSDRLARPKFARWRMNNIKP
jgi:hypothetical protein